MADIATPSREEFETLLDESMLGRQALEGRSVPATVIAIENDNVVLDVGLKTEGRIPVREFVLDENPPEVGGIVEVYLERIENALGEAVLSRDKARREEAWIHLEQMHLKNEPVDGVIVGKVKGGFTVELGGASAFLPGSQVDIRPVRDISPLMNKPQPFAILKMDRPRGNIVVSRRAILEESRAEQRAEFVQTMKEGDIREGVVKNITDYGAFVDLGGIDGLLHVTDMSWKRIMHPSQVIEVGETLKVQIIKINSETQRISLGMKQLQSDPWEGVVAKYPLDMRLQGKVTNITDYGAFVELEDGVEGLIHVSEMSWTKKNAHPGKIVMADEQVDIIVLDVDTEKRRISLGLKQCTPNPWADFVESHPIGSEIEGEVRGVTEFGLFIGLGPDLDGMVHINDIDWYKPGEQAVQNYNKGDIVKAKVLDVDVEKERISLGIKQLVGDVTEDFIRKGKVVTCTVTEVTASRIGVSFGTENTLQSYIKRSDLSRDRSEQRPERFAVGDKVDAKILNFDKQTRQATLSVKALEIEEEKEAIAQYGSADSGASLGDILGAALAKDDDTNATETEKREAVAPTPETKSAKKTKSAAPE